MSEFPSLSVIIATHERPQKVACLIADLSIQENAPQFEILICDDGSCSETLHFLDFVCRLNGAKLLTQEDRGFRVASARNMGLRNARNEIVVFLDDDIRVLPNFLREHGKIHNQETNHIALIGPRLYVTNYPLCHMRKARCPWKVCYTCNLSVQLTDLMAVQGFDESFMGYGLEDNELAYRLFKSGVQFVSSHRIPVFHENEDNPKDPFKRAVKGIPADFTSYIENAKRFMEKHTDDHNVQHVFSHVLKTIETYKQQKGKKRWRGYQINIW